jgi:CheY-like chemotaxis protein
VLLPALETTARPPSAEPPARPPAHATGTILLIDDDEAVRDLGAAVLERAGYQPLIATDGVEGVAALRAHSSEVVCVLLDLTMPRLDGADALSALRAVREDVPVILCSGYPEETAMALIAGMGVTAFLAKPYGPNQLIEKLEDALAAAAR